MLLPPVNVLLLSPPLSVLLLPCILLLMMNMSVVSTTANKPILHRAPTSFSFLSPCHVIATDIRAGLVVSTAADNDSVHLLLLLLPVPLSCRYYPLSYYFGVPVLPYGTVMS